LPEDVKSGNGVDPDQTDRARDRAIEKLRTM